MPLVAILYPRSDLELAAGCRPDLTVYHCTDNFTVAWDGREDARFVAWEQSALARASLVVATQPMDRDRFLRAGHSGVELMPNGFDERVFDGHPRPTPDDVRMLPRPIIGYAGSLYPDKLDLGMVARVARRRPAWTLVFVGPVLGHESAELRELRSLPNVHVLGVRPFPSLAAYVSSFDVAINPHRRDPVGRAFEYYPMKAYDALAMGRAVVLTPDSRLQELHPHARFAGTLEEFIEAIEDALRQDSVPGQREARIAAVRDRSWSSWIERFESIVVRSLPGSRPRA